MILPRGNKVREDYLKKGNVLWHLRNTGGGGKGCMAGGVVLLVMALILAGLFAVTGLAKGGIVFGAFFGVPGLLMVLVGFAVHRHKMSRYISYYVKETGFDAEEIRRIEQEIHEPDMFMVGTVPIVVETRAKEKRPQIGCIITKNYMVMPMVAGKSYVRRIRDMIAATYSYRIPGMGSCRSGLVFLSRGDDIAYTNSFLTEDACQEVMEELWRRNPELITVERFAFGDRQYDIITDSPEIVKLYEEQMAKAISFKGLLTFPQ